MRFSLPFVVFCVVLGIAVGVMLNPLTRGAERAQVALWLEVVHRVGIGIGGLGSFVALIVVVRQFNLLRAQSELVRKNIVASMDAQLYGRLDSFNRFVFEHNKEYLLLDKPYLLIESPDERSRLHRMCELGFTFFEEIFKHHLRLQLLDTEDWDEWEQNFLHFFGKPYVRGYWKSVVGRYGKRFQDYANGLIERTEPK